MPLNSNSNPQDDEVSTFIDQLYSELMILRFEYMSIRKKGKKDTDEMLSKIVDMNDDFESLIKAHTLYLRFKKATGQTVANHSAEMIKKINEIKSNVGKIVREVPKQ